ncbi:rod shape-determining protein MreC,rod shape-determining protein MreC,rod shape-determining protein MreC [Chlamydia poikilotherma]|uniref:Cell shape-determining protein MreC n=1 Tax=Chlamydia poikilotherma TaxID=1967783 RepID=A0A3B0PQN2_9CHLA|nr:rod shape-determining protein MreC [Chlamydia poikilotherma]SYX08498.1 rod shape-determining protein MreC,rod shape-determining protein MreC,rod shape-determining protein MreC [Chlamydia poikilotherma]
MCAIKKPEGHRSAIKTTGSVAYRRHRKNRLYVYLVIALSIILCWSLPKPFYENLQKHFIFLYTRVFFKQGEVVPIDYSIQDVENIILKDRIAILEERLQAYEVANYTPPLFSEILSPYFRKLIASRVIYRDPSHWGSSCWINVGKEQKIQKNSPVLSGKVLVGLVDYVGEQQSRIRLITDVGMQPSVIAVRGGVQAWLIKDQIQSLTKHLERLSDSYILEKDKYEKIDQLEELNSFIHYNDETTLLLRGTLSGSGGPLWKDETLILHGEGFCFSDGKGLRVGDILITTGLDGVFPPGLFVAEITKVCRPREGACSYKVEAKSLAEDLTDLSSVLILPAMEFNPNDRPDIFGLLWD